MAVYGAFATEDIYPNLTVKVVKSDVNPTLPPPPPPPAEKNKPSKITILH